MDYRVFVVLVTMQILLAYTPGPAVLCVTSQALSRGALRSIWATLGILAGNGLYFVLSGTGVGALLLTSYRVFSLVRWFGAAYLLWMGFSAIFGRSSAFAPVPGSSDETSAWRIFLNGVVVQLSNPKALVYFTALVPQFIDPHRNLMLQLTIIAAVAMLSDLVALISYAALAGRVSHLSDHPRFRRVANVMAGTMLITAAVATARLHRG